MNGPTGVDYFVSSLRGSEEIKRLVDQLPAPAAALFDDAERDPKAAVLAERCAREAFMFALAFQRVALEHVSALAATCATEPPAPEGGAR